MTGAPCRRLSETTLAVVHKAFHCLHGAALSAEVIEIRITALRLVPRHEGKALPRLAFFKAGNIAQDQHPPVVRFSFSFCRKCRT